MEFDRNGCHNTHCCKEHGCKYGDADCPVEIGNLPGIRCESCGPDMRELIAEKYGEEIMMMDGYDNCIVGVVSRFGQEPIVCYDMNKVVEKLLKMSPNGMTREEAEEWFEYNQIGAWVGPLTPCFLDNLEET